MTQKDRDQATAQVDTFLRKIKIKATSKYQNTIDIINSKNKTTNNPLSILRHPVQRGIPLKGTYPGELDAISGELRKFIREFRLAPDPKRGQTTTDPKYTRALDTLSRDRSIVIKPADKGAKIVIQDRDKYIWEAMRQLSDTSTYKRIDRDMGAETAHAMDTIIHVMHKKKHLTTPNLKFLTHTNPPVSERSQRSFYLLPKIHKEREKWAQDQTIPPGRPIVSDVDSVGYNVTRLIDLHLAPYSNTHPSYLKNTQDFIQKLSKVACPQDTLLVSLDVDSLYTNIDHDLGLEAVRVFLNRRPHDMHQYIIKLLEISLTHNDFLFNGERFLQIAGTAMGKRYAPRYADITMAYWEEKAQELPGPKPTLYLRYLDDIFLTWPHGRPALTQYISNLNGIHPKITLKSEISATAIDFLDTTVYKGDRFRDSGHLDTKVFFKPTDSHALLHASSHHPKHTFHGIIKSQVLRFARNSTSRRDFEATFSMIKGKLGKRGYGDRSMKRARAEILNTEGHKFYDAHLYPPSSPPQPQAACQGPRCALCPNMMPGRTHVEILGTKHILPQGGSCDAGKCIYLIICRRPTCPNAFYVGQTVNIRNRMNVHRYNIKRSSKLPVAKHFYTNNHTINDMNVYVLERELPTPSPPWLQNDLDTKEATWIKKLQAHDLGLNLDAGKTTTKSIGIPLILSTSPLTSPIRSKISQLAAKYHCQELTNTPNQDRTWTHVSLNLANSKSKIVKSSLPPIEEEE